MPRPFSVLALLVVAACAAPATGPEITLPDAPALDASMSGSTSSVPLAMTRWVACANGGAGENVLLSGELRMSAFTVTDDQGGTHYRMHVQPDGVRGLGAISGLKYRGTGGTVVNEFRADDGSPYTYTMVNNFRIIGQGPGNNLLVHATVHRTVNANGDLVSSVNVSSMECQ